MSQPRSAPSAPSSLTDQTLQLQMRQAQTRWWALLVLALAQFLVVLDASVVNIALPSLGAALHLDTAALSWVITAYVLPFGGLLLLGGRLADRFGHRRVFLLGVLGFTLASAAAGLAASGAWLLGARAVQGAAAALLAPAALALVTRLFPQPVERGKALGIWGAVAGIGSAAGVLLGGLLTARYGWPAVFFVNVPVGALVLLALPRLVAADPASGHTSLDLPGAFTVTGGLVALVAALTQAERLGFTHPLPLLLVAAAVALLALFVWIERRITSPLVPFSVFRVGSVLPGNVAMLLIGGASTGLFFALSVFMQRVLHDDALTAGLTQLPLAGALVAAAGVVPALAGRLGERAALALSLLAMGAGLIWLAAAPENAHFTLHLLGPTLLIGSGLGGAFVTGTQLAVAGVGERDAGLASGLINTSQQIGGAVGLALLATLAAARTGALSLQGAPAAWALTSGFHWAFLGAAAFALLAALVVAASRERTSAA